MLDLKRFGRWKSDTVAQGYVDSSVKRKHATMIMTAGEEQQNEEQPKPLSPAEITQKRNGGIVNFNFYGNYNVYVNTNKD